MFNESEVYVKYVPQKYGKKSMVAQLMATVAQNTLYVALGMHISITILVIKDLLHTSNNQFTISITEASWFGSLMYVIYPIGCFLSGILQEKYGKKLCMIVSNIPSIIGWILVYFSHSSFSLYVSTLLMGFSSGFGAGSTSSYVGEISEPRLRGLLGSIGSTSMWAGSLGLYILDSFYSWRTISLLSLVWPIISSWLVVFIPESPVWLLAKGENVKAERALRWLRGWTDSKTIELEFLDLVHYNKLTEKQGTHVDGVLTDDRKGLFAKCAELKDPSVYKPMKLMMIYFFVSYVVSIFPARPYITKMLAGVDLSHNQNVFMIILSSLAILGCIISSTTVHVAGKRFLTLSTLTINSVALCLLGVYVIVVKHNFIEPCPSISLSILSCIYFFGFCGISSVPLMLLIEVFPNKNRGIATGLCTGMSYILLFILIKSYVPIETFLSLEYTFILFGSIGFIGIVYFYLYLPETENKTLLEIEEFFASH